MPGGQTATENDSISSNGVTYHNGALGGVPGVFIDDPRQPGRRGTTFTPTGPRGLDPAHGFTPDAATGKPGGPYHDKVVRQDGGRTTILRVDAQGRPVAAFDTDNGQVNDAPSPTDFLEFGEVIPALEAAGALAGRLGLPLLKAAGKKAAATFGRAEATAAEGAEEPLLQLGGAHRDVRGVPGYQSHHMPAKAASPLAENDGPAIAMRTQDHQATASWGRGAKAVAYRQKQAEMIANGDFKGAQQMDIDDIRQLFGNAYDAAIAQMLKYSQSIGY
jgi:hypothetical protein